MPECVLKRQKRKRHSGRLQSKRLKRRDCARSRKSWAARLVRNRLRAQVETQRLRFQKQRKVAMRRAVAHPKLQKRAAMRLPSRHTTKSS